jgi:5-formyltetrahydrofolate cyclo-ligase
MSPKHALRGNIKKLLKCTSGEQFRIQGERAAALLRSSPLWSRYKTIFLFLSMNTEIDTQPLFEAALNEGKKVFAPKIEAADRLVFYSVSSVSSPWNEGPFGIREPAKLSVAEAGDFPAIIITPGLAFDKDGNRLGRGGGYYDRFFAELDNAGRKYSAVGLCMDFQLVEKVPAETHDKKMDGVLTGKELLNIR